MDSDSLLALVQNDDRLRQKVEALILREQEDRNPRPVAMTQQPEFFFVGPNQAGEVVSLYPLAGECRQATVRARIDDDWAVVYCLDRLYVAKSQLALWESNLTEDEASRYVG